MTFLDWTKAPTKDPPPFGLRPRLHHQDESFSVLSWEVGLLAAQDFRPDLDALRLRFKPGRGNSYTLDGQPVTPKAAAFAIAARIRLGAANLAGWMSDSLACEIIRDCDRRLADLDRDDPTAINVRFERQYAEATLPHPFHALDEYATAAHGTAKAIERWPSVQAEVLRTFRPFMTAPSAADDLSAYLASRPSGFVPRSQLAAEFRNLIGSATFPKSAIFSAAEKRFGPAKRRRAGGTPLMGFDVP